MSELGNIDLDAVEVQFDDCEEISDENREGDGKFFTIIILYLYCIRIDVPSLPHTPLTEISLSIIMVYCEQMAMRYN